MVRPERHGSAEARGRAGGRGRGDRRERAALSPSSFGRAYDLVGHALGLLSLTRPRLERGVAHYVSDRGLSHLVLARRGYGAITFGHVIVSSAPLTEHGWRHELAHVAQYDRLGLAFVPLYLWHYARVGYARHPFEREAEAVARARVSVRLATDDDVSALRRLVNAAYAELEALGLNFTGTYQDEEITRRRGRGAEVYLLFADDRLVGTVSVRIRGEARPPHAYVNQLAVDPAFRHRGIGSELTAFAELVARERGVRRVRLDTAIPARHLLRFYERRGYRVIGETRWEGKTYRSAILEKMLGDDRQ